MATDPPERPFYHLRHDRLATRSCLADLDDRGPRTAFVLLGLIVLRHMHVPRKHLPQLPAQDILPEAVNHTEPRPVG